MNKLEYFNPNSPKQVKEFLLSEGIRLIDTSETTLEANKDRHPLIAEILKLRTLTKLKGTYIDGYSKHLTPESMIHSDYAIEGTETGRCHSRNPNVQNVPKSARVFFTSRFEGGKLVSPDCSALEYRLIGHETKDAKLLQIFQEGRDIHRMAATFLTGKPESEIDDDLRREMKTVNYAACYGAGKDKFYNMIGREDYDLFQKTKALYPGVNHYKQQIEAQLGHTGRITNIFYRQRQFTGEIDYSTLLEAVNWIFQSSGHLVLKAMVIRWYREICDNNALDCVKLAQEGHDSCIFDTHPSCVEDVARMVKETDLNRVIEEDLGVKMTVPMLVDVKISSEWK